MDDYTFIGTATGLLRLGPFTLLTDPNFLHRGEAAYLGYGLFSKRLTDPALQPADLPPLDAVVLSHLHGDHWDRRARSGLEHDLPVITTRHAARRLRLLHGFGRAVGLRTWDEHRLAQAESTLTVTAVPAAHSSNPLLKAMLPPVMGSLLELTSTEGTVLKRIYITGDTMPFAGLAELARRGPIDTAIVHVGGTRLPGGFTVTMTGRHAAECLQMVQPAAAIPIHFDDYSVFKSPLDDVRRAVDAADLDVEMRYVARGDVVPL